MKIRTGFVSNSSSSSFVCECCGNTESGWDLCKRDADFAEIECDHDICNHHVIPLDIDAFKASVIDQLSKENDTEELIEDIKKAETLHEARNIFYESEYNKYLTEECPLCTLKTINDKHILKYLIKNNVIDLDKLLSEIRSKFDSLQSFDKYLKNND